MSSSRSYRWEEVDPGPGETRTPGFLAMNPNGKVPLLPAERFGRARVLQWMFFEQYSHEPYVAVARAILRYQLPDSPRRSELPRLPRGRPLARAGSSAAAPRGPALAYTG